jgi:transposase
LRDRTAPSVYAGLDRIFRRIGGVPTYLLTDNEKMVTTEHIASVAVRNPGVVSFARHYPLTEQRHAFAQVDGLGRDRSVMSGL